MLTDFEVDVEENNKEEVLGERKFLHDLCNKLLIAQGMATFVSRYVDKSDGKTEKDLDRCEKLKKSINDMNELIKERRAYLHSLSED